MSGSDPKYQARRGSDDGSHGRPYNPPKSEQSTWNLFDHRNKDEAQEEFDEYTVRYNAASEAREHEERAKKR